MKFRSLLIFFVAVIIISTSCNVPLDKVFSRYGSFSTEPGKDEITGVWVANEATLNDMRERGKYSVKASPKFIFQADGNFKMENMPDWWHDSAGQSFGGFETSSGTWELSKIGCCWDLCLHFNVPNFYKSIGLLEHRFNGHPKYLIEFIIGDPDSGDEMIFVKQ